MAQITSDAEMAPYFSCAASPHPSITLEDSVYGGNSLDLMKSMKCPTLLMPAMGDPDEYRAGLYYYSLLGPLMHDVHASQEARCSQLFPQAQLRLTSPQCSMVFLTVVTHQIPKFPPKLLAQLPKFFLFLHAFDFCACVRSTQQRYLSVIQFKLP
jgi:hypothetical protein